MAWGPKKVAFMEIQLYLYRERMNLSDAMIELNRSRVNGRG